jgi:hypothetical protein
MTRNDTAAEDGESSTEPVASAGSGHSKGPLWRVATPGVCRLVDDPQRLASLLEGRPDASVVRLGRGRSPRDVLEVDASEYQYTY